MKRFLLTILIFSFLLPIMPVALAEDSICVQAKNAHCGNVAEINGTQVKKKCSSSVFQKFSQVLYNCLNKVGQEREELESQIENIEQQERSAEWYLSRLDLDVRYLNYEIADLSLSINQLENEIEKRRKAIKELSDALAQQKEILSMVVLEVYEYDITSYIEVLLGYGSLSEFGTKLMEMDRIQIELRRALEEIQNVKEQMEKEKKVMERDMEEKLEHKKIQEYSRYSLEVKQEQQEYFLLALDEAKTPLEREMARIQTELIELREAMGKIQSYLTGWLLGQRPTWSQIFAAVSSASNRASVDMFTMLAILQVESSFRTSAGSNAGSPQGNLKRCHDYRYNDEPYCSTQKRVFEEICAELGLNKNVVPISPAYAMGPAQFIPTTWRGYQRLYPGLRNPWNLNDAVLAMAYKLKRGGIKGYNPGGASWYVPKVKSIAAKWKEIYTACGGFDLDCKRLRNYLESIGVPAQ